MNLLILNLNHTPNDLNLNHTLNLNPAAYLEECKKRAARFPEPPQPTTHETEETTTDKQHCQIAILGQMLQSGKRLEMVQGIHRLFSSFLTYARRDV